MRSFLFSPLSKQIFVTSLRRFSDRLNVQCIDSEVALKLLYFLLPADVLRCVVGGNVTWFRIVGADIHRRELRCWAFKLPSKSVLLKLCPAGPHAAVRCEEVFREKMSVIAKLTLFIQLIINTFFFLWRCNPTRVMASSFLRFSRSHTTTHHSR